MKQKKSTLALPKNSHIVKCINSNVSFSALFRELRDTCKHHGETLIVARIIDASVESKKRYSRDSLNYLIREHFQETIYAETRNWLYNKLEEANKEVRV